MKFKEKEELKEVAEILGLGTISKISSINYLARKTGINLEAFITLEIAIQEIEVSLWSLIPLACENHEELFEKHHANIKSQFDKFINLANELKNMSKDE